VGRLSLLERFADVVFDVRVNQWRWFLLWFMLIAKMGEEGFGIG